MINVVVSGAMGRMGQRIIRMLKAEKDIGLSGALERADHPDMGKDVGELIGIGTGGIALSATLPPLLSKCDVVIDFTFPGVTLPLLQDVLHAGKAMVIGTTGFSDKEMEVLHSASQSIAMLLAPNMSVGVNLLLKILPAVAETLGQDYDVEIIEAHHHFKKDAPSGTAAKLAEVIAKALHRDPEQCYVHGRQGMVGERRPEEIGIHAVRGGDIVGDHTVMFCGTGERIELSHRASSRDTFAKGAIRAAKWITRQPAGLYSMHDVLAL
jgi:4-hydroxy-tetrahydrodipicolinate reductase